MVTENVIISGNIFSRNRNVNSLFSSSVILWQSVGIHQSFFYRVMFSSFFLERNQFSGFMSVLSAILILYVFVTLDVDLAHCWKHQLENIYVYQRTFELIPKVALSRYSKKRAEALLWNLFFCQVWAIFLLHY